MPDGDRFADLWNGVVDADTNGRIFHISNTLDS